MCYAYSTQLLEANATIEAQAADCTPSRKLGQNVQQITANKTTLEGGLGAALALLWLHHNSSHPG